MLLGVREAGRPDRGGCALDLVVGAKKLDIVPEQGPERPLPPLVRPADAAGDDEPVAAGDPVDLDMRVPGHHEVRRSAIEHRRELVVRRQPRDEIVVEARRCVTERRPHRPR